VQIHAKPRVQAFAEAVYLSVSGLGRQRNGVQIFEDNPLPFLLRIHSGSVDPEAGSKDLAKFIRG
jgi:hypothetical protein